MQDPQTGHSNLRRFEPPGFSHNVRLDFSIFLTFLSDDKISLREYFLKTFFWFAPLGYLYFQFFFDVIASKSLTSIQYTGRVLNPLPLGHGPSALTTRPRLLALWKLFKTFVLFQKHLLFLHQCTLKHHSQNKIKRR